MISYGAMTLETLPVSSVDASVLRLPCLCRACGAPFCKNLKASACIVSARSASPVICRFSRTSASIVWFNSIKVALAAPRLKASIPTLPVPAKRSRKRASSTRAAMMLKSACLTRSIIGRVPLLFGPLSLRPLASPVTTRIFFLLQESQYHFYLADKIIFFGPGNQRLKLVIFELIERRHIPYTLDDLLQLLIAYLRIGYVMQYF